MSEQTFAGVVRESRVFYRRGLVKRLALAQLREIGGLNVLIVARANEITEALFAIEDAELAKVEAGKP